MRSSQLRQQHSTKATVTGEDTLAGEVTVIGGEDTLATVIGGEDTLATVIGGEATTAGGNK